VLGVALAFALVAVGTGPALAASPSEVPCGTVTAYTAPTASVAGSIRLGTRTFVLAAGTSRGDTGPTQIAIGTNLCVNGQRDAGGTFTGSWLISPLGHAQCGQVVAFTPATATTAGSIKIEVVELPVAAGLTLSQSQVTGAQCFTLGVNAQGDVQVAAYAGPFAGAPAGVGAPAATNAPASTNRPAPAQLPNTATGSAGNPLGLVIVLIAVVLLLRVAHAAAPSARGAVQTFD